MGIGWPLTRAAIAGSVSGRGLSGSGVGDGVAKGAAISAGLPLSEQARQRVPRLTRAALFQIFIRNR
jgi:hypothetical protein